MTVVVNKKFGAAVNPPPLTVTSAERLALLKGRARPQLAPHLRPEGSREAHVHKFVETMRERRIEHISERLNTAQAKLRHDTAKSANTGRAKAGFNYSAKTNDNQRNR